MTTPFPHPEIPTLAVAPRDTPAVMAALRAELVEFTVSAHPKLSVEEPEHDVFSFLLSEDMSRVLAIVEKAEARPEERRPNPIEKLTITGRALLVLTLLLFVGGAYASALIMAASGLSRQYPVVFLLMPGLVFSFCFFFLTSTVLERCGVRIYTDKPPH